MKKKNNNNNNNYKTDMPYPLHRLAMKILKPRKGIRSWVAVKESKVARDKIYWC